LLLGGIGMIWSRDKWLLGRTRASRWGQGVIAAPILLGIGSVVLMGCSATTAAPAPGVSKACTALNSLLSGGGGLTPQFTQRLKNVVISAAKQGLHPESVIVTAIEVLADHGDDAGWSMAGAATKTFATDTLENSASILFAQTVAECDIFAGASRATLERTLGLPAENKLLAEVPTDISKRYCHDAISNLVDSQAETAVECSFPWVLPSGSPQPTATLARGEIWYLEYPNSWDARAEFGQLSTENVKAGGFPWFTVTQPIVMYEGALTPECSAGALKADPVGLAWMDSSHNSVGLAVQCYSDKQTVTELMTEFRNGDFDLRS
jgi:hypothetical protein